MLEQALCQSLCPMECLGLCPPTPGWLPHLGFVLWPAHACSLVARCQTLVPHDPLAQLPRCTLEPSRISGTLFPIPRRLVEYSLLADGFVQFCLGCFQNLKREALFSRFPLLFLPQSLSLMSQSPGQFFDSLA